MSVRPQRRQKKKGSSAAKKERKQMQQQNKRLGNESNSNSNSNSMAGVSVEFDNTGYPALTALKPKKNDEFGGCVAEWAEEKEEMDILSVNDTDTDRHTTSRQSTPSMWLTPTPTQTPAPTPTPTAREIEFYENTLECHDSVVSEHSNHSTATAKRILANTTTAAPTVFRRAVNYHKQRQRKQQHSQQSQRITMTFAFDTELTGLMIGNQGCRIKEIKQIRGVRRIEIGKNQCTIVADTHAIVHKAKQLLQIVKDTSFEIPRNALLFVIGKEGSRIQNTKQESGLLRLETMARYMQQQKIYNWRNNGNGNWVQFVMIGTKNSILVAKQMLQQQALYALNL